MDITVVVEREDAGVWELFAVFPNLPRYSALLQRFAGGRHIPLREAVEEWRIAKRTVWHLREECVDFVTVATLGEFQRLMRETNAHETAFPEFRAIVACAHPLDHGNDSARLVYGFDQ
jgi:hypothetical protein